MESDSPAAAAPEPAPHRRPTDQSGLNTTPAERAIELNSIRERVDTEAERETRQAARAKQAHESTAAAGSEEPSLASARNQIRSLWTARPRVGPVRLRRRTSGVPARARWSPSHEIPPPPLRALPPVLSLAPAARSAAAVRRGARGASKGFGRLPPKQAQGRVSAQARGFGASNGFRAFGASRGFGATGPRRLPARALLCCLTSGTSGRDVTSRPEAAGIGARADGRAAAVTCCCDLDLP